MLPVWFDFDRKQTKMNHCRLSDDFLFACVDCLFIVYDCESWSFSCPLPQLNPPTRLLAP